MTIAAPQESSTFPDKLLEYTAQCIEHSGTRKFFDPLFRIVHQLFEADQCVVFFLDSSSRMKCLLSRSFIDETVARALADAYVDDGYHSDPNLAELNRLSPGETKVIHLQDMEAEISDSYQQRFFSDLQLIDKVSILQADSSGKYYINLYRTQGRCSFIEDNLFTGSAKARLLATLITQHYRLNQLFISEGPLATLSDRERQVCQGILRGKKMESIAVEIGIAASSTITYKKRAYTKLGINSRTALFNLCHQN